MSRGKKNQQQTEEVEEEARSSVGRGEPAESEMMLMFRAMLAEQRRADEVRDEKRRVELLKLEEARKADLQRLEDLRLEREREAAERQAAEAHKQEELRGLREKEAAERQAALQKEIELRQYDQQVALLKIQQEMGEKASQVHREHQSTDRRRDRALYSIPMLKDGEDIEEFLSTAERRLGVAGVRKDDWISIVDSKLSGKTATAWQDIVMSTDNYQEARDRLLKSCGYTPRLAADKFFGFRVEQSRGLTADQLYHRGQQLLRRVVAPGKLSEEVEFSLLRGWVGVVIPKRARAAMDARTIGDSAGLVNALQDFLALEGEKSEGQTATFKRSSGEFVRERVPSPTCYKCGKPGHKAANCWRGGASGPKGGVSTSGGVAPKVIVCFTCGVEGHKSPQCPKYVRNEKVASKESKPKPVKRVWQSHPGSCAQVVGMVDGKATPILLDSGAAISVVPESLVAPERLAGCRMAVRPFGAAKPMLLPVANVPFKIGSLEWVERVAVAPTQEGVEEEVLCSLDLVSERGLKLVLLANSVDTKVVSRVTTRAQAKTDKEEEEEKVIALVEEKPNAKLVGGVGSDRQEEKVESEAVVLCDEPGEVDSREEVGGDLCLPEEEVRKSLVEVLDSYDDCDEDIYEIRKEVRCDPESEVPSVKAGSGSRDSLVSESMSDPSLKQWRALAEKKDRGFLWEKGLLFKTVTTHVFEVVKLLVLPKSFRKRVMDLAHEKLNHMGSRRVLSLLRQKFDWPGIGQDVIRHCRTCPVCQKCSKPQARKVPMVERKVMSEPFESMAFDIVGPMPKGKGGHRFLLTCVCMASRWPEAIPLRSITASAVAQGMVEVFSRTGIPLQLVSDQGSQFVGKVVSKLCKSLNIDRIQTSPYRPEGNGVVERMHGTLGAMLTKAASSGLDWVGQVPFALFALRSAPNRDTGFSPFELTYGRYVRTPLDILHQGWAQQDFAELDTDEWAQWLTDRLECWHDVARERGECASSERKKEFDKKALERVLEEGDWVLCRVPGMVPKLKESWHGPYQVLEKLNRVNYKVEVGKGRQKVLHINNMKKYQVRGEAVLRMAVVAEEVGEDMAVGLKMYGKCEDFDEGQVELLKQEYPNVFSDIPGTTDVCELTIRTGDHPPIASGPYRVPDRLKEEVKQEIDNLVEMGVATPSHSPWASPIVPVTKKDGKIRLCIDYRKLNSITEPDPYYMTTLDEILEKVGESGCLSKLDLSKGFYQIGIEEESVEKTTFVSPFGKYCFQKMPFGLKNAPALFQRTMEEVLRGCYQFAAPYIDDILVFSKNGVEHVSQLRQVLDALSKHGLTIKINKCEFGKTRLEYLGHLIGGGQVAVPRHRATAMEEFRKPETKKQLRSFLGAMSYYRRFVKNFANYSGILSLATAKSAPSVVDWSGERLEAFNYLKGSLVSVCVLTIPSQEDCFVIHSDASGLGVGATLNVVREGVELPVAFFSRQLQGAEKRYSATELEALAIFKAINFWDHFLYGQTFEVYTDHKALVSLLKSKRLNKRLYEWMLKLMEFSCTILYKPGKDNLDADGLSRQAWCSEEGDLQLAREEPQLEQPRAAAVSVVGRDVGIKPTENTENILED